MNYELIINSKPGGIWMALLGDGELIELHQEKGEVDYAVGDIFVAKVKRVVPNLNAAFVDVGYEKDAFLHYLDLGPQFQSQQKYVKLSQNGKQKVPDLQYFKSEKDIDKGGKIDQVLGANTEVLVQVAKEPISSKGPRLTSEITLAGRYMVLVPFSDKISVSSRIQDPKEKQRLKRLVESIRPKNFGVIIRTVAANRKVSELDQDLTNLLENWKSLHKEISKRPKLPKKVFGEVDRASSLLRDMLNDNFTSIVVNDAQLKKEISDYIASISPGKESIVSEYKGRIDVFERYGVYRQIKSSFGKKVPLKSGGYLIVEHTEAMHVIDVNSGNRKAAKDTQEDNALKVNLEAATQLARILRLRDMGGIIAVDFIDMHQRQNNKMLHDKLREYMADDKAKHHILHPSKFGVVEITRQRVRPETDIKTSETCPTCNGTGEIQASIMLAEEIGNTLKFLLDERKEKDISVHVHPYLAAYLTKGWSGPRMKWFRKYKKWVPVRGDSSFHLMQYSFLNKDGEEIPV